MWGLSISQSNGQDPGSGGILYFKVVVIGGNQRKAHPNVNHHNYAEVKAAYNLQD